MPHFLRPKIMLHALLVHACAGPARLCTSWLQDLADAHGELKERMRALKAELSDTRAKLELSGSELGLRSAREAALAAEAEEAAARLRERGEELEALRRSLKARRCMVAARPEAPRAWGTTSLSVHTCVHTCAAG